jgi:predicted phage terminase large subunit-like protein
VNKAQIQRYLALLQYELALVDAEASLISFAQVTMPMERHMDDPSKTKYDAAHHHHFMAELMEKMERGQSKKTIINTAPRHGKSEICTRRFAAWYSGRHPERDIIVATYGSEFAKDFGVEIRDIIKSQRFRQIFPDYQLDKVASDHITNTAGGNLYFLGRRSPVTGRGGDLILVDDPTKDDKEAGSADFREDCWQWFTQTLLTRRHTDQAAVNLTQTRWHEDDLVGRLTDPSNPVYSKLLNKGFQVFNIAAIAGDDDPMGRKPGEVLWPQRFGREYLEEMQEGNPKAFAALYLSNPVPDSGVFYQKENLFEYDSAELPNRLTMYCASDHAVSTKAINDRTCILPYGVCEKGDAWIMPDVVWDRIESHAAVERIIEMIIRHKPMFWYSEKGQIARSIGPFIEKRMQEEGVYVPFVLHPNVVDKTQFAHSARARCAQGRIRFPRWAPWWQRAKTEMLKFPNGRFDDFVDTISTIGMRMNQHNGPGANLVKTKPEKGTFAELKEQFRRQDNIQDAKKARAGW